jgi:hypothetical protein
MRKVHVLRAELLDALKGCLHDLEELKLISPGDLDIIDERRILRQKIAKLEEEGGQSFTYSPRALWRVAGVGLSPPTSD